MKTKNYVLTFPTLLGGSFSAKLILENSLLNDNSQESFITIGEYIFGVS